MNGGCATNIMSALYDHAKQYEDEHTNHVDSNGGSCMSIYLGMDIYGNAIIGRYGGCFEEDIRRLMCDRAHHITGFGRTGEVCTDSRCEKG